MHLLIEQDNFRSNTQNCPWSLKNPQANDFQFIVRIFKRGGGVATINGVEYVFHLKAWPRIFYEQTLHSLRPPPETRVLLLQYFIQNCTYSLENRQCIQFMWFIRIFLLTMSRMEKHENDHIVKISKYSHCLCLEPQSSNRSPTSSTFASQ